jgi:hypothetical protein
MKICGNLYGRVVQWIRPLLTPCRKPRLKGLDQIRGNTSLMNNSLDSQGVINLEQFQFVIAYQQRTDQVRDLVQQLTGSYWTSKEILQSGRKAAVKISCSCGLIVIQPDYPSRHNRLWRWNVGFIPMNFQQIA